MIDAAVHRLDGGREDAVRATMMRGIEPGAAIPLYVQVVATAARDGVVYQPRMGTQPGCGMVRGRALVR